MDAVFAPTPLQSLYSCSEDMFTRCRYIKVSPLSLPAKFSSARVALTYPLWGALVKLRSLPLSVRCSSSAHKNDGYGGAHNDNNWQSSKDDYKYLEAEVVKAVSLLPSQGHLFMTMANGGEVEVNHVNPPKGRLLYRTRNPAIFLKILSDRELILPIIVGDIAVGMLMKALRGEEATARPNQYHLMRNLISSLNFEIRMVKVTERVSDTYLSRIFMGKPGEEEMMSVDARPSDAINLAVRCKVPIFVNEDIVFADAVKPVHASTQGPTVLLNYSSLSNLDRPAEGHDPVAEEITLMKNMLIAVVEERYNDAARWRDDLNTLRAQRRRIRQHIFACFALKMASYASTSSGEPKSLMEIKRFDGTGFDLWKERIQGILFLKDCEDALLAAKPENFSDEVWEKLNKKAIAYIKMAVTDEVLTDIKRLPTAYAVWEKLTSSYENRTPVNQEALVVSLSNNAALTYDGVRGSILNEEISRKSSGEGSGTAYHVRDRSEKRNNVANRGKSRNKSKGKSQDVTCYQ
ncbi:hypothetical protein L7F22_047594 [Adiantum nelumboides]|nr:hypothetical protein [Adiantum nelumboides]